MAGVDFDYNNNAFDGYGGEGNTQGNTPTAADLDAIAELAKNPEVRAELANEGLTIDDSAIASLKDDIKSAEEANLDAALATQEEIPAEEAPEAAPTASEEAGTSAPNTIERLEFLSLLSKVDTLELRVRDLEQRINDHNARSGHKI